MRGTKMRTAKGRRDTPCAAPSRPLGDTCGVGGGVYHQAVCDELHINIIFNASQARVHLFSIY